MSLREQLTAMYPEQPGRVQILLQEYLELTTLNRSWTIARFIQFLKGVEDGQAAEA